MPEPFDISELPTGALSDEIRRLLEQNADIEPVRFLDSEFLVRETDDATDVFLVLSGSYVVEQGDPRRPDGRPMMLGTGTCSPAEPAFVGEMTYFAAGNRSASVRSAGAVQALRLKARHIDRIIQGYPGLTRALCRRFSQCLRDGNQKIRDYEFLFAMKMQQIFAIPGQVLFRAGDDSAYLYQWIYGRLVLEGDAGSEVIESEGRRLGFIEPRPFFQGKPYDKTLRAETDSLVIGFSAESREQIVRNFPALALELLAP
ncbi:MAG: cyclic nucleotide-binding domain-containing protein [Kiritimatiellae bacterium]|nr:cyclic nucleotide-binding domain-containing protein [Kiritimatiellia bacterium]